MNDWNVLISLLAEKMKNNAKKYNDTIKKVADAEKDLQVKIKEINNSANNSSEENIKKSQIDVMNEMVKLQEICEEIRKNYEESKKVLVSIKAIAEAYESSYDLFINEKPDIVNAFKKDKSDLDLLLKGFVKSFADQRKAVKKMYDVLNEYKVEEYKKSTTDSFDFSSIEFFIEKYDYVKELESYVEKIEDQKNMEAAINAGSEKNNMTESEPVVAIESGSDTDTASQEQTVEKIEDQKNMKAVINADSQISNMSKLDAVVAKKSESATDTTSKEPITESKGSDDKNSQEQTEETAEKGSNAGADVNEKVKTDEEKIREARKKISNLIGVSLEEYEKNEIEKAKNEKRDIHFIEDENEFDIQYQLDDWAIEEFQEQRKTIKSLLIQEQRRKMANLLGVSLEEYEKNEIEKAKKENRKIRFIEDENEFDIQYQLDDWAIDEFQKLRKNVKDLLKPNKVNDFNVVRNNETELEGNSAEAKTDDAEVKAEAQEKKAEVTDLEGGKNMVPSQSSILANNAMIVAGEMQKKINVRRSNMLTVAGFTSIAVLAGSCIPGAQPLLLTLAAISAGGNAIRYGTPEIYEKIQKLAVKHKLNKVAKLASKQLGLKNCVKLENVGNELRYVYRSKANPNGVQLGTSEIETIEEPTRDALIGFINKQLDNEFKKQNAGKLKVETDDGEEVTYPPVDINNLEAAYLKFGGYKKGLDDIKYTHFYNLKGNVPPLEQKRLVDVQNASGEAVQNVDSVEQKEETNLNQTESGIVPLGDGSTEDDSVENLMKQLDSGAVTKDQNIPDFNDENEYNAFIQRMIELQTNDEPKFNEEYDKIVNSGKLTDKQLEDLRDNLGIMQVKK